MWNFLVFQWVKKEGKKSLKKAFVADIHSIPLFYGVFLVEVQMEKNAAPDCRSGPCLLHSFRSRSSLQILNICSAEPWSMYSIYMSAVLAAYFCTVNFRLLLGFHSIPSCTFHSVLVCLTFSPCSHSLQSTQNNSGQLNLIRLFSSFSSTLLAKRM